MNQEEQYIKIAHQYFVDKPFLISNFGNVKNTKTGNIRTPCPRGRIQFDESTILSVGRLVALTFLAEPDTDYSKRKVRHLDKNLKNNNVNNLQWI
jgi:hypothetical protein